MIVVGVDTGGTFTDLIYWDEEGWHARKKTSTPADPAEAILAGLADMDLEGEKRIVHGSTVATNALLERKGAITALISNQGFTDILAIGRQNRPRLYDLSCRREPPLVPEERRFGVQGRILRTGEEHEPLDEEGARRVVEAVRRSGAESVAVCFLFSFADPSHEQHMGKLLAPLGIPVSLSHEILAEFREYERTSTTVVNAYVGPKMQGYVSRLEQSLGDGALRIMQSNGGAISAVTAMREPVRTILSGPAGGVVGALHAGRSAGFEKLITFDMGGTSTDVSLADGEATLTSEAVVSGCPVKTPMIDIHTVGAGGGSIAMVDLVGDSPTSSAAGLTVGPESAGADPGPLCLGRGDRVTVTDANLYLGRLLPEFFLGGHMTLHPRRLDIPFKEMAATLKLTPMEVAEGVIAVADAAMERAVRVISVERGHDPGEFTMLSYGGAGGLHAASMARLLNIPRVLVPEHPGLLSAMGMLLADVIKDYSLTVMRPAHGIGTEAKTEAKAEMEELDTLFALLAERGRGDLLEEGVEAGNIVLERGLDMRYQGQSFELAVAHGPGCIEAFHALHEKTYGHRMDRPVEIVNLRLRARGVPDKPQLCPRELGSRTPVPSARRGVRETVFDGRFQATEVYDRAVLLPGNRIQGPAIIGEYSSTLLVPPWACAEVDLFGNIVMDIKG
jgi:N-methylhydantoinase A